MRASDSTDQGHEKFFKEFHAEPAPSAHDDIVVWLYNQMDRGNEIFDSICKIDDTWDSVEISKKIEHPIMSDGGRYGNRKAIGFADLLILVDAKGKNTDEFVNSNIKSHLVRFPYEKPEDDWFREKKRRDAIYIEVKTKVNIGETIRQINYYKANALGIDSLWYVCAPAFSMSDILIEQGIGFIEYKP